MDRLTLRRDAGETFLASFRLLTDLRLTPGARLCWLYLAYRAQHGSPPTVQELANVFGSQVRTIRHYFRELERTTWISVVRDDRRLSVELGDGEITQ